MTDPKQPAIGLSDGRVVKLPPHPSLAEFALPGNSRDCGEFLACFDETTGTAAMFFYARQCWQSTWPVTREEFERQCAWLRQTTAVREELGETVRAGLAPKH